MANEKEDYIGSSPEVRKDITSVLKSNWKHQPQPGRYLKKWFTDGEGRAVYREMTEQEVNDTIHRFFGRPTPNPGAARAAVEALGQEVANDDPDTDDIEGDDKGIDEDDVVQFIIACWREMTTPEDPTDWTAYDAIANEVAALLDDAPIGGLEEAIAAQFAGAAVPATGQISEEAHDPIKQFNVPSICPPGTPQHPPRAILSEDDGDIKPVRLLRGVRCHQRRSLSHRPFPIASPCPSNSGSSSNSGGPQEHRRRPKEATRRPRPGPALSFRP
jgi:hypothetical protein